MSTNKDFSSPSYRAIQTSPWARMATRPAGIPSVAIAMSGHAFSSIKDWPHSIRIGWRTDPHMATLRRIKNQRRTRRLWLAACSLSTQPPIQRSLGGVGKKPVVNSSWEELKWWNHRLMMTYEGFLIVPEESSTIYFIIFPGCIWEWNIMSG